MEKVCLRSGHCRRGFTLLEIMIVVLIIALVMTIAIPSFNAVRRNARIGIMSNEFRQLRGAFETFSLENGRWPDEAGTGALPADMEGYIGSNIFEDPCVVGGNFDWDGPGAQAGFTVGISLQGANAPVEEFEELDNRIDDGDLATGLFQSDIAGSDSYTFILEE